MFLSLRAIFCPLHPPPPLVNAPENKNFEKKQQKIIWRSGDVIFLNLRDKKHNQMMYAYSDMECDRQFFFILGHFLLFYPTIDPEN